MGLAIFMLFIVAIFLVVVALVVTGIIFIVFGIENRSLWRCESAFRPKVSVFRNRRVFRKRRLIRVSSCEVGYEADFLQKGIDSKHFTLYTISHSSNG